MGSGVDQMLQDLSGFTEDQKADFSIACRPPPSQLMSHEKSQVSS